MKIKYLPTSSMRHLTIQKMHIGIILKMVYMENLKIV